jgi:hypothetical protein
MAGTRQVRANGHFPAARRTRGGVGLPARVWREVALTVTAVSDLEGIGPERQNQRTNGGPGRGV